MGVEQRVLTSNRETRERLESLVARLEDEEFTRTLGDGRTVATILGHIAFWDQRTLILLRRWLEGDSTPSPADVEPEDVDWINDAAEGFLLLVPPRELARFTLETAREVDGVVEGVPAELVAAIEAAGHPISLDRGNHRGEHLDELEAFLGVG
jgi:hypothetical protein